MIVPIEQLLCDSEAAENTPPVGGMRYRRNPRLAPSRRSACSAHAFRRSAAGWVGDAIDLMGTRVSVELWADDETRGRELVDDVMRGVPPRRRRDEHLQARQRNLARQRSCRRGADGRSATSCSARRALARSSRSRAAAPSTSPTTASAICTTFARAQRPTDRRDRGASRRRRLSARRARSRRRTIFFKANPACASTLGGIAKGYVVERAAAMLRARGVEHALLNAGGDTRVIGDRRGQPWIVGIRHPRLPTRSMTRLPIVDEAISTSGDYERFFEENGHRYHHVINPRTGRPTEGILTVTVIGPDGTMTDGLDTAIFVLGVEKGLELIKRTRNTRRSSSTRRARFPIRAGSSPRMNSLRFGAACSGNFRRVAPAARYRRHVARVLAREEAAHLHRRLQLRRAHVALIEQILHRFDEHRGFVGADRGQRAWSANTAASIARAVSPSTSPSGARRGATRASAAACCRRCPTARLRPLGGSAERKPCSSRRCSS